MMETKNGMLMPEFCLISQKWETDQLYFHKLVGCKAKKEPVPLAPT
jgi:hypothetical protein